MVARGGGGEFGIIYKLLPTWTTQNVFFHVYLQINILLRYFVVLGKLIKKEYHLFVYKNDAANNPVQAFTKIVLDIFGMLLYIFWHSKGNKNNQSIYKLKSKAFSFIQITNYTLFCCFLYMLKFECLWQSCIYTKYSLILF